MALDPGVCSPDCDGRGSVDNGDRMTLGVANPGLVAAGEVGADGRGTCRSARGFEPFLGMRVLCANVDGHGGGNGGLLDPDRDSGVMDSESPSFDPCDGGRVLAPGGVTSDASFITTSPLSLLFEMPDEPSR